MKHGSLFSGIGGFDLAAEWMGWENTFHCEINEFGRKALKYYWPEAESYEDITKTDFTIWRGKIDILTGGFPCQPFSAAGKRKGIEDPRHLWPEYLRAIQEIQPSWVVGENVYGIVNWSGGLVFEQVQADLEAEGYQVQPFVLPACGVNAPHRRDRIWFVAHSDKRSEGSSRKSGGFEENRGENNVQQKERGGEAEQHTGPCEFPRTVAHSENEGGQTRKGKDIDLRRREMEEQEQEGNNAWDRVEPDGTSRASSDPSIEGLERGKLNGTPDKERQKGRQQSPRPAPKLYKIGNWGNFPTQSPICSGDDGISPELSGITVPDHRKESLMAYGNSFVPQVALQIFKTIEEMRNNG